MCNNFVNFQNIILNISRENSTGVVQIDTYVTEIAKENYIMNVLMKIILCSCNKKHLSSYQIYVNELTKISVSKLAS